MSDTQTAPVAAPTNPVADVAAAAVASVTSALSSELKTAVRNAVTTHVANVQADAAKVLSAVETDLAGLTQAEKPQIDKLVADIKAATGVVGGDAKNIIDTAKAHVGWYVAGITGMGMAIGGGVVTLLHVFHVV